jgi:FAD/FMN-containing dehydrogenase
MRMTDATTTMPAIDAMRAGFNGELILPGDAAYDMHRELFNKVHDKHPAVIARCVGTADVVAALRYARANDLEIAVRSGGRHMAGFASSDGGLVIDLSLMRGVKVDRREQTAWVQAGCRGGDVQAETLCYGLGAVTGAGSTTGIGGVNLHGGVGWMSPKLGWGSDTILELELLTADGDVLHVAPDEHADLFWAARGAASNFGVVTWMKLKLAPVAEKILAGSLIYAGDQIPDVLRALRELDRTGSDHFQIMLDFLSAPPEEWVPEELHGKLALSVTLVHVGELADAETELGPLIANHPPAAGELAPHGLLEFMRELDGEYPPMRQWYDEEQIAELSDEAIDLIVEQARALADSGLGPMSTLIVYPFRGPLGREPEHPAAYRHGAEGGWSITTGLFWEDEVDDARHEAYSNAVFEAVRASGLATGLVYGNVQQVPDEERLRRTFGEEGWQRLTEVKAQYDPNNVFHLNHNIPPAR